MTWTTQFTSHHPESVKAIEAAIQSFAEGGNYRATLQHIATIIAKNETASPAIISTLQRLRRSIYTDIVTGTTQPADMTEELQQARTLQKLELALVKDGCFSVVAPLPSSVAAYAQKSARDVVANAIHAQFSGADNLQDAASAVLLHQWKSATEKAPKGIDYAALELLQNEADLLRLAAKAYEIARANGLQDCGAPRWQDTATALRDLAETVQNTTILNGAAHGQGLSQGF